MEQKLNFVQPWSVILQAKYSWCDITCEISSNTGIEAYCLVCSLLLETIALLLN